MNKGDIVAVIAATWELRAKCEIHEQSCKNDASFRWLSNNYDWILIKIRSAYYLMERVHCCLVTEKEDYLKANRYQVRYIFIPGHRHYLVADLVNELIDHTEDQIRMLSYQKVWIFS